MSYEAIESYGLIGDMHALALVSPHGSVDYLCLPRFDSPSVFAALLDDEDGGRFRIAPTAGGERIRQFYVPDTNILLTRFLAEDGVAEVIDFMPTPEAEQAHRLVRLVKTVRGAVPFALNCEPRFDYGRAAHSLAIDDHRAVFASKGPDGTALRLHSGTPLAATATNGVAATFTLRAGEQLAFVLEVVPEGGASPVDEPGYAQRAFATTLRFWRRWMGRCDHASRWPSALNRSALALKLLTSQAHGSIAAAATFGLPEGIRGERNWDYRYTWIRDGSLTAATLLDLGYLDEARAFAGWLRDRLMASDDGQLQIMYGIDGRQDLREEILEHLSGYKGSKPVRVGNGAYHQLQLDIYGEMLLFLERYDALAEPIHLDAWPRIAKCVGWVAENWDREDEGVWEVRGGRRRFLYSRLMDWVALERALRIAERRSLPAPVAHWREVRDVIHREINERFWDAARGVYVQYRDSTTLDASCLLMPLVGFVGARDPRWLSTLDAIGRELVDDSLVYRYRTQEAASDGLAGGEGTFSMCTFWYVDCLARAGRLEEARLIFEKMLHYAGPAGLYAEELGPTGEHLGNYPQAFTHLGLVGAARSLDVALDGVEGRGFRR